MHPPGLVIPTFVWVFYFQTLFRPSDSFQLFCGISVLSPDFGRATSSNFCVGFPPSKRIVFEFVEKNLQNLLNYTKNAM